MRDAFKDQKRIVVKVGTSTLTYPNGKLNLERIEALVRQIADLQNRGKEMLLVTSGAVGSGANRLGWKEKPKTMPEKQALAAIGQGVLMHTYEKLFSEYNQVVAQVLMTREDIDERVKFLNMTSAFNAVLALGAIPIINENDTVAVHELKFGDNDTLSSMVAGLVTADLLILLSDVEGLYTKDPRSNSDAELISTVDEITAEMEGNSIQLGSAFSSGGMITKLRAAKLCMSVGIPMVIANSDQPDVLRRIVAGENLGTVFVPKSEKLHARKKWIGFGKVPQGVITVDAGCEKALLQQGKSLLASGITGCSGDFEFGSVVSIFNQDGREIARGIAYYAYPELTQIQGKQSKEVEAILGYKDYDEVVHRDNLYVM